MKLATSWIEDTGHSVSSGTFHDEVEEQDEVKEAEDGWGGVAWQQFVLKKPQTSNKLLHELAREIRGIERRRAKRLNPTQYRAIFDKWENASRPFLRPGHDYFTEFLAKLDCVTVPKGETLQAAFERAKRREPPSIVRCIGNERIELFASLCQELQEAAGDQPIILHQESVAKLFGHSDHRNISNWIKALKTLGVLVLAEPAVANKKAARYFYMEKAANAVTIFQASPEVILRQFTRACA